MYEDAKRGQFDAIIVHKLDRFARNKYDSTIYRYNLKKLGIYIYSVLEQYDPDSPEGKLMEAVLEGMNEFYIQNLVREIKKGMHENAYKAKFTGGMPPLGYDIDEELNYVVNPFEAETVRIIFSMMAAGHRYAEISERLKKEGRKTKIGNDFVKTSYHDILRNEKYYGLYEYYTERQIDSSGRRNTHKKPAEEDIIRVEDGVPAIISKEEFFEVQKLMDSRRHMTGGAKETYLLKNKIFCEICGAKYFGKEHKIAWAKDMSFINVIRTKKSHIAKIPQLTKNS